MKDTDSELRMRRFEESLRDVQGWQQRHTKIFCFDCRMEGLNKVRTIDGFTVYSCDKHLGDWVGCSCHGRTIGY